MRRFSSFACLFGVLMIAQAVAAADEDGFKPIFNGKNLDGWDGDPKFWRVEDGAITGETTAANPAAPQHVSHLAWRQAGQLRAEGRVPHAQSGLRQLGHPDPQLGRPGKWQVSGYQPDMDAENQYTGICYGENYRGILAQRGQKVTIGTDHKPKVVEQFGDSKELAKVIKKRDWNEYHIIAQGNHIIQKINGQLMCELTDEDTVARKDGVIALQIHAGPPMKVQFRNLRLKELP